MTAPAGGEMPFLDHLEELRKRLLVALGSILAGCIAGVWAVQQFKLVVLLKKPIEQYLPDGKLSFTSPTEPVMIVFKLGLAAGLVLASPVVIYQIWAFLSPALYDREKRVLVPALVTGLLLFMAGGALAWIYLVPQAIAVLFSFQGEALTPIITYDAYFDFVLQLVLAMGLSFELPLVLIILASLGLVTPSGLSRFRRFFIVLAFIAGAILSPGTEVVSQMMMTIPLLLLYEVGVAGASVIHRRRVRAAAATAALVLCCCLGAGTLHAQDPAPRRPPAADSVRAKATADAARADSVARARGGAGRTTGDSPSTARDSAGRAASDTLRGGRPGPAAGTGSDFAEPDSVMQALLKRSGYTVVRFRADSARIDAQARTLQLLGTALTEREGAKLAADSIAYDERACLLEAGGDPKLVQGTQTLVGGGIRYDTCRKRGVVRDALTSFPAQGTTWFLRGSVAQDSTTSRLYAGDGGLTSCDLPEPHYSFRARSIKWIENEILVARPVVLYVRDVPLLWLPFVFQDLSARGRKSGILIPKVGLADLVRTSSGYQRQITNFGYYWAANDYLDATLQADWYSARYVRAGTELNYNVLHRFMSGRFSVDRIFQNGGGGTTQFRWNHQQTFSVASSLKFDVNYATSTTVLQQNVIDPRVNVQQLASGLGYQKRFRWGSLNLGGNRRQNLSDGSGSQQFPALGLSPNPITLSRSLTWSPDLRIANDRTFRSPAAALLVVRADGRVDTIPQTTDTRVTSFALATPLRFGSFQWSNTINAVDRTQRSVTQSLGREPLPGGGPADSLTVATTRAGTFSSEVDWQTGINLPIVFPNTWRVTPTLGIQNTTSGAFAIRNERTGGAWVTQGKRFGVSLAAAPALFGFLPSFLPGIARIRHAVNPQINFNYAPAATVPIAYAQAIAQPGQAVQLRSNPQMTISFGLQQSFEGKTKPLPDDTLGTTARKIQLLTIQTSPITYDFEQAKLPGRSGWVTGTLSNSFLSELLPGFNVSTTHDLFLGQVGSDTARFDPFLTGVQANFSISNRTVDAVLGALGLVKRRAEGRAPGPNGGVPGTNFQQRGVGTGFFSEGQGSRFLRNQGFNASINYTLSRQRFIDGFTPVGTETSQQNVGFTTSFSPTPLWNVSWQAQFNATRSRFESQSIRLERDLHEWRASFSYQRTAFGNSAFFVSLGLIDIPQLKLDYNRTSIERNSTLR